MDDASEILIQAATTIKERAARRDLQAERSMARTVAAFNAIYGTELSTLQGWQFMALLKITRASIGHGSADDYIDQAAYAALAGECAAARRSAMPPSDGPQYRPEEVAFRRDRD